MIFRESKDVASAHACNCGNDCQPESEALATCRARRVEFVTLDWSDEQAAASAQRPTVYRGRALTLAGMQAQLLRDPETIKDAAGRFKGKVANLACPSCGASIAFSPGATTHLLCRACHAAVGLDRVLALCLGPRLLVAGRNRVGLGARRTGAGSDRRVAKWMTILLVAINAKPMLFSPGRVIIIVILAVIGRYLPAWLLDKASAAKADM